MTERYYYRFETSSILGKKFRSFWNECNKAERAAEVFAKKVGAAAYYSSPSAFAGGVAAVAFEPGKANGKIWRSAGRTEDGEELWEPDVKQRNGVLVLPRRGFKPSDTATRIYSRRISSWQEVKGIYTLREWAKLAGVEMPDANVAENGHGMHGSTVAATQTQHTEQGGENGHGMHGEPAEKAAAMKEALEKVERKVNEKMEKELFCQFIELYRDDEIPVDPTHPKRKTPLYISQSIRIERERMLLPVVTVEKLYALMEADQSGDKPTDGKPKLVENVTPTFFEWGGRYYIGIEYPCKAEGLEPIIEATYRMKMTTLRQAEEAQRIAEKEGLN